MDFTHLLHQTDCANAVKSEYERTGKKLSPEDYTLAGSLCALFQGSPMLALLELESLWELRSILKDIEAKVSDLNDADRELIQKMFRAGKNFDDILKAVESNHAPKASSGFDPT